MSTIVYSVDMTPMIARQEGERYAYEMDGCESEWLASFDTLDEAIAYADGLEIEEPSIFHTKYGLDSVGYSEVQVCSSEYDEDDEGWLPAELEYSVNGLSDRWKAAMRDYEQSYWKWLDYESGCRDTLEECLERRG